MTVPPRSREGLLALARRGALAASLLILACEPSSESPRGETAVPPSTPSERFLITNARLYDGLGGAPTSGSLRVDGGRIAALGDLEAAAMETVIDAGGLGLAPGFVDSHSHHDAGLQEEPEAIAAVSQGITTIVVGQDGGSQLPLSELFARLEQSPAAVNVASFAGHNSLRRLVMGEDFRRPATEVEIERMAELLAGELAAGALGLSTGLEYDPGIYSETAEVIALAEVAAGGGGRYISHLRSEDRYFWSAVEELIEIGRATGMPVQISHVKLAMTSLHGQAGRLLERLDKARAEGVEVTADLYPYPYWQSTLEVLFPERDFEDVEAARFAVEELSTPSGMLIADYLPVPEYAGKTLAEIADLRGESPARALIELIALAQEYRRSLTPEQRRSARVESVIATSMAEDDIESLLRWQHTTFCSDGALRGAHPRGFGAFPRFLGRYVRERGVIPLEEAIRRGTSLAADQVGLEGRGRLVPGAPADLVLFDPATVIDAATTEDPHRPSVGIHRVWVNGREVWRDGESTGERPGEVLRRGL